MLLKSISISALSKLSRRVTPVVSAGFFAVTVLAATSPAAHAQTATTTTFSFVIHDPVTNTNGAPVGSAPFGALVYQLFTVAPASGTGVPTGSLTLTANRATYPPGTAQLDAQGHAKVRTINAVPNSYSFAAVYSGDSTFSPSTGTGNFVTTQAVPTVTVTSSASTVAVGASVTLSAVVDTKSFYQGPTGTVTFFSGTSALSSAVPVTTVGGSLSKFAQATATLPVTGLPVGANSITAVYSGDIDFTGATSAAVTVDTTAASGLQFVAVTPCRVVDTRNANAPELDAASGRDFAIPQGPCGIPTSAVAYSLNATVVPSVSLDYLTIWPSGQPRPNASTLNSDGRIKANAAIVTAGVNGAISVYASNATQVILDIDGYFVPKGAPSAMAFYPVPLCRVADTRYGSGALGAPFLSANSIRPFPVQASSCNIPSNAQAYSLNITALPHHTLNYLTAWPTGQNQPYVSTLNAPTGAITANAAIVPAASNGEISIFVTDDADVVLDINGYFAAPSNSGLSLYPVTPCRAKDTRPIPFSQTIIVSVEGPCSLPATALAYVLNATVVPTGELDYLTLWPDGETQPFVSTLNAVDGSTTSNMAIMPTNDGAVGAFASGSTNLILDVSSYFAK